jgi:hypothetical protein
VTLALTCPATLDDMAALLAPDGDCAEIVWRCVLRQVNGGPSYAVRTASGRALAIGGVFLSETLREVWFVVAPDAAAQIAGVIRCARLTLLDLCQSDPRPVFTLARTRAGERIARAIGFVARGDGLFEWERQCPQSSTRCSAAAAATA